MSFGPARGGAPWRATAAGLFLLLAGLAAVAVVPTFLRSDAESYEWRAAWGEAGGGPGQFRGPVGVAVDGSGFVYVSDSGNDRIQKFTASGEFVAEWGGSGEDAGQLRRPMHLALVADSLLYVAEYVNDRVQVFGLGGATVRVVSEDTLSPSGALDAPGGVVSAGPAGPLWIPDFFNHRVAVYGPEGGFRRPVGTPGRWLPGRLHYPTDVALGPDSTVYVADAYNHRIQRFAVERDRLDGWGGPLGLGIPGPWRGWFSVATGVHVDRDGRVHVADFYNHRVQTFGPAGSFRAAWGEPGAGEGEFERPTDVATGPDGRIYVADFGNDRIQVWRCVTCEG